VPDTAIVVSFVSLLQSFSGCFTAPSAKTFVVLASGWVLTMGRHTITGVVRAADAVGWKHIRTFHRFFANGRWSADEVGLLIAHRLDRRLGREVAMVVAIDDTLGRHTGKAIAAASMHRDPLLSTAARALFHWGHLWVVAGITLHAFGKTWCLPILFRLYRSRALCTAGKREFRNCPQLAAELVALLAQALPHRQITVVGDAAYSNCTVVKGRPKNVQIVGRSRLDAALYEAPPLRKAGQIGRPRVRGAKVPSPQNRAALPRARWHSVEVTVYGRTATVRVLIIDAVWYVVTGSEVVRLVLVRGFPGHERDDVLFCTDRGLDAKAIIELFAQRWSLEVTFHETKGKLGFEDPQNRSDQAVERTAPMALWLYSLVVLWYLETGQHLRAAQRPKLPWYASKTAPAFSDMLATLRRASFSERLFDPRGNHTTFRKRIDPLLRYLEAVA
jgi:hypothetical protein